MKKYAFIVLTILVSASCKDMLNTAPADQIASGNMWTTESLADQGMNGLYKNFYVDNPSTSRIDLTNDGIEGYDRQSFIGLEFQSFPRNDHQSEFLTDATKKPDNFSVGYDWEWGYTGIHRINDALENLHKAGLSEEKYERYICEAKFLRAWYYSYLNKIYQGVPLYLEVVSNEECTKGASTSTEIWDVVISDLTDCIENEYFPDNTLGSSNYGRPSKGAAYSLRGEAYMWLAWENGEDNSYYQLAANDLEKVSECGYALFAGDPVDFYNDVANEKDPEMIFPIQFTEDSGYGDYIDTMFGVTDVYEDRSSYRPSFDFLTYFQNADGSKFDWAQVEGLEGWNDAVFVSDPAKREVYFLRDSISYTGRTVDADYWNASEQALIQERFDAVTVDVMRTYYLKDGNSERIKKAFENRDPRLKQFIVVPYEAYTTYRNTVGRNLVKYLRWPYVKTNRDVDNTDLYTSATPVSTYFYKKFVRNEEGQLIAYLRTPNDWPLIHYTDVYLYLAECYVHLGKLSEAVGIVNEIRARAGMPSVSVGSSDEVMEAVRYERRVELCCEGIDWFDEWRWGTYKEMKFQGKDIYGAQSLWGQWENYLYEWFYADCMYPWSAPADECVKNPNLHIADGWNY